MPPSHTDTHGSVISPSQALTKGTHRGTHVSKHFNPQGRSRRAQHVNAENKDTRGEHTGTHSGPTRCGGTRHWAAHRARQTPPEARGRRRQKPRRRQLPGACAETYVPCVCEDTRRVGLLRKRERNALGITRPHPPHATATLALRARVHMHPKHAEFSKCFCKRPEMGREKRKGAEKWKRGQGIGRERSGPGTSLGPTSAGLVSLSGFERCPWGGRTDLLVAIAGAAVPPGK